MAVHEGVAELAKRYGRPDKGTGFADLKQLANGYLRRRTTSILDAAAIGFAFDALFSEAAFDISKVTPEMAEAWRLAYPNVPIESLAGRSLEEVAGAVNGWKGKLFEVEVTSRLNDGEWVGDLQLEPGQIAKLADSPTQPGWDLQILNEDGTTANLVQLKATESVGYVHEALERYPDTPILATSEVASHLNDSGVIATDISNDALTNAVHDQIADATSDSLSDGVIGSMPVSIIFATEAYNVMSGKKNVDQALNSGGARLAKGAVSGAVAAGVSVVATPLVGAVAGVLTRILLNESTPRSVDRRELIVPRYDAMHRSLTNLVRQTSVYGPAYGIPAFQKAGLQSDCLRDVQELASYVEDDLRFEVLREHMPIKEWCFAMLAKDTSLLSQADLEFHLEVLRDMQRQGVIDRIFDPGKYTLGRFGRAWDVKYRDAEEKLIDEIAIGELHLKKFKGTFSSQDAERVRYLKLTKLERFKYDDDRGVDPFRRSNSEKDMIAVYLRHQRPKSS